VESFALHFSGTAAARLDEPPLCVTTYSLSYIAQFYTLFQYQNKDVVGSLQVRLT